MTATPAPKAAGRPATGSQAAAFLATLVGLSSVVACVADAEPEWNVAIEPERLTTTGRRAKPLAGQRRNIRINTTFMGEHECRSSRCYCTAVGQVVAGMRVRGESFSCTKDDVLTAAKEAYIRLVLADAVRWLSNALKVEPETENVKVLPPNESCGYTANCGCGAGPDGPRIPASYSSVGLPNVDMIVFATAVPAVNQTQAFASTCQLTNADRGYRPTVGKINFAPSKFSPVDAAEYPTTHANAVLTAIHELMHALGFSSQFFDSQFFQTQLSWFPDSGFRASQPVGSRSYIVTKKVVEKAREHFGCPTLIGVALENQGAVGTLDSHWEKRWLGNEVMTGVQTNELAVISAITLAYFEDTGLYDVDYTMAGDLVFGKNRGCDFVEQPCNRLASAAPEFCFVPATGEATEAQFKCTVSAKAYGPCSVIDHTSPIEDVAYRYFANPTRGSSIIYADYCPTYIADTQCTDSHSYTNECTNKGIPECTKLGQCFWSTASEKCHPIATGIKGNKYGENSRCFNAFLVNREFTLSHDLSARCFAVTCSADRSSYYLEFDGPGRAYCNSTLSAAIVDRAFTDTYTGSIPCQPPAVACSGITNLAKFEVPDAQEAFAPKPAEDPQETRMLILYCSLGGIVAAAVVIGFIRCMVYVPATDPPPPFLPTHTRHAHAHSQRRRHAEQRYRNGGLTDDEKQKRDLAYKRAAKRAAARPNVQAGGTLSPKKPPQPSPRSAPYVPPQMQALPGAPPAPPTRSQQGPAAAVPPGPVPGVPLTQFGSAESVASRSRTNTLLDSTFGSVNNKTGAAPSFNRVPAEQLTTPYSPEVHAAEPPNPLMRNSSPSHSHGHGPGGLPVLC